LHIIDTAGLHNSDDIIEKEGIRRAHAEIDSADVVLLVYEAQEQSADYSILPDLMTNKPIVTIRNKIDLTNEEVGVTEQDKQFSISMSAKTGSGIELLREVLIKIAGYNPVGEEIFLARKRHLLAISSALKYIKIALKQFESGASELVAEDLRQASMSLGSITGEFSSDDLLGEIFSSFCIGK
jgi:tRNA modification GTPase